MLSTSTIEPSYPVEGVHMDHIESNGLLSQIRNLYQYLRDKNVDVLVALEALSGVTALPATKLARCKLIIWEHANYYQNQGSRYTHALRHIEMFFSDAYVVLTKRDLANFRNHFNHIRTRLVQIYNIAEKVLDVEYDITSTTIISAGHINKIKNFSVIPKVAVKAFDGHPKWNWIICGDIADDGEYQRLRECIAHYSLEGRVILCGRCNDMDAEYRKAALYVMTSLQEGFPMVLLEAKAHGLPIVSFNIETGPDEIVHEGLDGYLVDDYDIEVLARKIALLIEDDAKRADFSAHATTAMDSFNGEQIVHQWVSLLNGL